MSLALKLVSLIIPLASICIVLLPPITSTLVGVVYMSQLVYGIRDILVNLNWWRTRSGTCIFTISKQI